MSVNLIPNDIAHTPQASRYYCGVWPELEEKIFDSGVVQDDELLRVRIGVVIPAHNAENTIVDTIESIRLSLSSVDSIFVIENGSSDATWRVLVDKYAALPNIILKKSDEANASVARNMGVELASIDHDYVALCDADDLWQFNKLSLVRELIIRENFDLCFHPMLSLGENRFSTEAAAFLNKGIPCSKKLHWDLASKNNFIPTSAVVIKASALVKPLFLPELRQTQDFEAWCAISRSNEQIKVCYIDEILGIHRWMGGLSKSVSNRMVNVWGIVLAYTKYAPIYTKYYARINAFLHIIYWLLRSACASEIPKVFNDKNEKSPSVGRIIGDRRGDIGE